MRIVRTVLLASVIVAAGQAGSAAETSSHQLPPSPYHILGVRLAPPVLDPIAPCLGTQPSQAAARRTLDEGGLAAALAELDAKRETEEGSSDPESRLVATILSARNMPLGTDGRAAWQQLSNTLGLAASPGALACGWLELARLELRLGRIPEARVTASRALRAFAEGEAPISIQRAARFYRAESLAGTGDVDAALETHAQLALGKNPVARASRLRLADAKQDHSPRGANRLELERLVRAQEESSRAAWAPRLAELAIADGDFEAAKEWLDMAIESNVQKTDELAAAIAVRRVDLRYAGNNRKEKDVGQKALRELSESGATETIQRLALIREIQLRNHWSESSIHRLERAFEHGNGRIAAYAAGVLARGLLATSRFTEALETLVELAHRRAHVPGERIDAALFDQILTALATTGSCEAWIANVSGRRDLLMRHASEPAPFLRLGDCYQRVGMAAAALETYRGVAKSFGPTSVSSVTLRSAQAEFQLGRLPTARAAARANVRANVEPRDAWRLLYARILLADDQVDDAVDALRPALRRIAERSGHEPGPDEEAAILLGARLAAASDPSVSDLALLRRAIARQPSAGGPSAVIAEASVIAADLHRRAGEFESARKLYAPGLNSPDDGVLRSRSAYWLGVLSTNSDEARALWSRVSEGDDPWARLAVNEIALVEGRAEVGHPLAVPHSRLPRPNVGDSR